MTEEQARLFKKAGASLKAAKMLSEGALYDFSASAQLFVKAGAVPARFHAYLLDAQDARNLGDYDSASNLTEEQAAEQIARAEEFLQLAEEFLRRRP
jgi:uncharacterized protein (UPF0332 family)